MNYSEDNKMEPCLYCRKRKSVGDSILCTPCKDAIAEHERLLKTMSAETNIAFSKWIQAEPYRMMSDSIVNEVKMLKRFLAHRRDFGV